MSQTKFTVAAFKDLFDRDTKTVNIDRCIPFLEHDEKYALIVVTENKLSYFIDDDESNIENHIEMFYDVVCKNKYSKVIDLVINKPDPNRVVHGGILLECLGKYSMISDLNNIPINLGEGYCIFQGALRTKNAEILEYVGKCLDKNFNKLFPYNRFRESKIQLYLSSAIHRDLVRPDHPGLIKRLYKHQILTTTESVTKAVKTLNMKKKTSIGILKDLVSTGLFDINTKFYQMKKFLVKGDLSNGSTKAGLVHCAVDIGDPELLKMAFCYGPDPNENIEYTIYEYISDEFIPTKVSCQTLFVAIKLYKKTKSPRRLKIFNMLLNHPKIKDSFRTNP